jgi:hypothetical protein
MEELGDARMRCAQLVKYVAEAAKLIENSSHRDHFFEVAGHLIQGIPNTVFLLQKALQATALAATRIDYEEIKQDLRPEKVDELERALQDVRVRQVQRRSEPWTPAQATQAIRGMVAKVLETGQLPRTDLVDLVLSLEFGLKKAEATSAVQVLESLASTIETADEPPSQLHLAALLRQVFADDLLKTPQEPIMTDLNWKTAEANVTAAVKQQDERQSRFEEGKPADPTENMSPEDAKKWKEEHDKNKDNFKSAAVLSPDVKLEFDTAALALRNAGKGQQPKKNAIIAVRSLAMALGKMDEKRAYDVLFRAADVMQASGMWDLAGKEANDEKESRFEEGKPADPTENMSPEDAKKWKEEHDKNKDNFKSAGAEPWKAPELKEMQDLLKKNGYDPKDAKKLQNDGMGLYELEHRIKTTKPGEMGSLEYTHDLKKKTASDEEWKEEQSKSAALRNKPLGEGVSAAALIKEMVRLAEDMFSARGDFRTIHTAVHDGIEGYPLGIGPFAKVSDSLVARAKMLDKDMEEWDHVTGAVANGLEVVVRDLKKAGPVTAANDEKESRFEEGKPADPTENMSPEDAKKWKEEHDKNKDNFKSAGFASPGWTEIVAITAKDHRGRVVFKVTAPHGDFIEDSMEEAIQKATQVAKFMAAKRPLLLKKASESYERLKNASSPMQWELAGEILDEGLKHKAFQVITKSLEEVEKALKEAKKRSDGMKKIGVGRTEDPTLVVSMVVPALKEHAEETMTVANQLMQRLD